ncbi:hypothetical protein F5Y06DRAFT_293721 [Hypoxylon sp. FL0890]|nr:hypothetical protein F5Y06DRAFT_293721 [Hypoxylon sp. FL0890]
MHSQSIILAATGLIASTISQSTSTISVPCLVPGAPLIAFLPRPSNTAHLAFFTEPALNKTQLATDACGAATSIASAIPPSLTSDAVSYQTQLSSYCSPLPSSTTTISGVGFSPGDIMDDLNLITAFADPSCARLAEATPASTATDGVNKGRTKNAAVARPTDVAAGAAAAVGVLGAVALL